MGKGQVCSVNIIITENIHREQDTLLLKSNNKMYSSSSVSGNIEN
jgi:hypothetical protein